MPRKTKKQLAEEKKRKERNKRRREQRYQQRLLDNEVKDPNDLLTTIEGIVKSVVSYQHQSTTTDTVTRTTYVGIRNISPQSVARKAGYVSRLEIEIKSSSPVKKLVFHGYSAIGKGDEITATVLKAKRAKLPERVETYVEGGRFQSKEDVLIPGDYGRAMIALDITDNNKARTDVGVIDAKTLASQLEPVS